MKVDFPDLKVVISEQTDALRFQGDGLFATNSAALRPDRRAIVESLARRLSQILPCYTIGTRSAWRSDCNPGSAIIEALQIEGHTDSTGNRDANLLLSTKLATASSLSNSPSFRGKTPKILLSLAARLKALNAAQSRAGRGLSMK